MTYSAKFGEKLVTSIDWTQKKLSQRSIRMEIVRVNKHRSKNWKVPYRYLSIERTMSRSGDQIVNELSRL